ncbi:MAG: PhoX family phosphatase [Pigmentiphaga sp.]|nr:PhoX family phosphatase [Pigmentiphaga sp.]
MSYLTDILRAPFRNAQPEVHVPGQMLDEIVAANPARRTILKSSVGLSLASVFGAGALTACGGDDSPIGSTDPTPTLNYDVTFKPLAGKIQADDVTLPEGYGYQVVYSAGDRCEAGSVGYTGTPQDYPVTETQAGGQHDGMHFYPLKGVDPRKGGLLAINHEAWDQQTLASHPSNTKQRSLVQGSNVGVSVVEVQCDDQGVWTVKENSPYNKRYSTNSFYTASGPAAAVLSPVIVGTLNNCASGPTPWGTYLTCEETTNNYIDNSYPANDYGWVVEIDPQNPNMRPVKRTAMGRFSHENTAYMLDSNNRLAVYMGDDTTPGCIYKFVPSGTYDPANRDNNKHLLDEGTLYVARFNGNGSGDWLELTQGKNGLVVGATDPGNFTQRNPSAPATVDFNTQADVVIKCQAAARVAGGTLMDRPEWITVGTDNTVYCTLTNNGSRAVTDPANPRASNSHGHIIRWKENGDSPLATTFTWEMFLLAGSPELEAEHLKGDINGHPFSSPDGIRIDPKGRLWVQTDAGTGTSTTSVFGNNSMYYVDQETGESKRFLVGPVGCEITGIAYNEDLTAMFINIQHPNAEWNRYTDASGAKQGPARSATIVVYREDGQPVGV